MRDMAAFIEERKMSRKKSNRLSLEQHKRKGESLFSEEKENTEGFTLPDFSGKARKRAEKKSEAKPEKEGIEHEEV